MKKWIQKEKNYLFLFFLCFIIYLGLGIAFSIYFNSYNNYDFFFDADCLRVFNDYSNFSVSHYRAAVHPLFVILFQPIVILLQVICRSSIVTILLIQSFFAAFSVVLLAKILARLKVKGAILWLLTLIYAFSFTHLLFSAIVETYVLAGFFLLLLWYFTLTHLDKPLKLEHYFILIILGVFSIGITLTNVVQFILAAFLLLVCNKSHDKWWKGLLEYAIVGVTTFLAACALAWIQQQIWIGTPHFLLELYHTLNGSTPGETIYMDLHPNLNNLHNVSNTALGHAFFSSPIYFDGRSLLFHPYLIWQKIALWMTIFGVGSASIFALFRKQENRKFTWFIAITLLFNLFLHLIYGNDTVFLYGEHYIFFFLMLVGIGVSGIKKEKWKKIIIILLGLFLLLEIGCNFATFYHIFKIAVDFFLGRSVISIIAVSALIGVFLLALLLCFFGKNHVLYLSLLFLVLAIFIVAIVLKPKEPFRSATFLTDAYESYQKYQIQLGNFKENYVIETGYQTALDYYFFGMGNRRKMVYQNFQLIDLETGEVLKEFEGKQAIIIPNRYMVVIQQERELPIVIYEDEEGVWIYEKGEFELNSKGQLKEKGTRIKDTEHPVTLLEFNRYPYGEVMRVILQEILFNVKDGKPYPNILTYQEPWYRDAMLGAMVLSKTGNLSLIKDWILNLSEPYDKQNGGVAEADNLGEALYLISLVSNKDHPLVAKILEEAKKLTVTKDGRTYLSGMTDDLNQSYYQTLLYKYGLSKLKLKDSYTLPKEADSYVSLAWWSKDTITPAPLYDSGNFPYLGWASYHRNQTGKLYLGGGVYPLTYERMGTYADYTGVAVIDPSFPLMQVSPTHLWHASEVFLYMMTFEDDSK